MKKRNEKINNQKTAKHSKKGITAFVANNFKYILATIAIIIAIIAVFFGESKLILSEKQSASVNFNILYYRNVQTEERFLTLADAVANATTLQNSGAYATNTIQVINGGTETSAVTIPAGTDIVLDLNGKTVTFNIDAQSADTSAIVNNGTLTITDNTITENSTAGKITSNKRAITNNGTLTATEKAEINGTGSSASTIVNDGTFTLNGATVSSTNYKAIYNGLDHIDIAKVIILDGKVTSNSCAIDNRGTLNTEANPEQNIEENLSVKISDGTITSASDVAVANFSAGTIFASGGTISGTNGIYNVANGTINITGGTVIGSVGHGVRGYQGTVNISSDSNENIITIEGGNYGVSITTGTATIDGYVKINATNGKGIHVDGGILTIGNNQDAVSVNMPEIKGNEYGVRKNNGTFNFYDGVIKGPAGQSITGTVADKPQDYSVVNGTEIIDGTTYETATLQKSIPDTIINTESMYVSGAQVRVDGVHNYSNSGTEGKNYEATTWADISGSGNNGAITSNTLKWGENYLEFDGESTWVNLGTAMNNDTYQTLEATFSIDELKADSSQHIISSFQAGGAAILIRAGEDSKNPGCIQGSFYINGAYRSVYSSVVAVPNKVYHVMVTYDGTDVKLYINGELADIYTDDVEQIKNQTITAPAAYGGNPTIMALGGNPRGNTIENAKFDGKIFSAAVYNRALTADEVVQNATASLAMAGGTVSTDNLTYTIRFPNAVTGFTADDITLTNGTKGTFTEVTAGQAYNLNAALSTNSTTTSAVTQRITVAQGAATVTSTSTPTSEASRTVAIAPSYQNTTTNKCYFNLQDAFNEVNAGETIQVLNSTMEPATTQTKGTSSSPVTLNLNGKIIGMTGTLTNSGYLTIDGTGTLATSAAISLISHSTGTLNIKNGNIEHKGTAGNAIYGSSSSGLIKVDGGTISTDGGVVAGIQNTSSEKICAVRTPCSFQMTGGTIKSSFSETLYASNTVTITGGTIEKNLDVNGDNHTGGAMWFGGSKNGTISGGIIKSTTASATMGPGSSGTGTLTINGNAKVLNEGTGYGIQQSSTKTSSKVIIDGNAEVTAAGNYAIYKSAAGSVEVAGGTVSASGNHTIYNNNATGTVTISGGTVENTGNKNAVYNNAAGTIEITGGTVEAKSMVVRNINSEGTVKVSGGVVTNLDHNTAAIYNETGKTIISGTAQIEGGTKGVYATTGDITVTGGKIVSTLGEGIYIQTGNITIGDKDDATVANTTSPVIVGKLNGIKKTDSSSGEFNFYDGIVYGPTIANTINGTVTDVETGYSIVNGSANYEGTEYKFATLAPTSGANYLMHDGTNVVNTYTTLKDAFDAATDGSKQYRVSALQDVTDASSSTPTVASGKNVTLDLNNKTVTMGKIIVNNGTLEITDTTVTNNATAGKITSSSRAVTNNGTLTATGKAEINNTSSSSSAIVNTGTFTLDGAKVSSDNYTAIVNYQNATARSIIKNGTVIAAKRAIDNTSGTGNTDDNEAVIIEGGTISASGSSNTVYNNSSGTIKISGGTITSSGNHTVVNASTGTISVSGDATISSTNTTSNYCAIHNTGGTINISGTSTSNPTISTAKGDAVYNAGSGTITISGGNITGKGAGLSMGNGTATITGGTISGENYGIWMHASNSPTVTLGTDDSTVSTASPVISATGTGGQNQGVCVGSGTLNFYDGIIKAPTEAKTISGTVAETPPHYRVVYGEDTSAGLKTAYLSNQYNAQFLAENLLDGYTLENSSVSYNTDTFSGPTNGVYSGTLTKSSSYWRINASKFTAGKTYLLRYKIQKTAGTLKNIAGASATATQQSFTVDGEASSIKYNIPISTPASNIADDTNEHTIEFKFLYNGNQTDNNIYIQPNRGYTDSVTVNLYDVELYEVVDERTKTYGTTLGTLPTPTRAGYSLTGWYTNDNLITTDKSDWEQGGINDADGTTSTNTSVAPRRLRLKDYQAVSSNATYTLTTDSSGDIKIRYVYLYDGSKNFIAHDSGNVGNAGGRNTVTFTTPSNCSYIRVALQKTNADSDTITVDELPTAQLCLTGAVTDATTMPGNDITCYAEWDTISTTITIRKNTGAWSDSGMKIDLSTNNSSNTATFTQTVSSGSEAVFENLVSGTTYYIYAGKHSSAKTTMVNTGLTIVAGESKTVDYYTISRSQGTGTTLTTQYDSSSGSSLSSGTNVLKGVTIYAKATINSGYHGTVTLKHGSTSMTASGGTFTVSKNETIQSAGAIANTYTIVFNKNASDASGTMSNLAMTYGTAKNLTANAFTRSGYVFAGWATSSTGSVVYTDGQSVNNLTTTNGGTVNLYAKWEIPIGTSVNYSTTLNGQTLSNWKVFYKETKNGVEYTYIILSDYLPRAAISSTLRTNYNLADGNGTTYTIKSTTNRTDLINAMATTSNWSELINNGSVNGTALSAAVKSDTNVIAKGAPDIELWVNSWNSASNGFKQTITTSQTATGYRVNGFNDMDISKDKSKANYSLYVPHTSIVLNCYGYWLASPSAAGARLVMGVSYDGSVSNGYFNGTYFAFRPLVCLPSSVLE